MSATVALFVPLCEKALGFHLAEPPVRENPTPWTAWVGGLAVTALVLLAAHFWRPRLGLKR